MRKIAIIIFGLYLSTFALKAQNSFLVKKADGTLTLNEQGGSHFAKLALKCIHQEFPNKLGHVIGQEKDVQRPKVLHPAFYGCFDWHSAVHGHWMLVRLLKTFPNLPESEDIRKALNQNLSPENILAEKAYFERKESKTFERTYGWAWLLKLAEELHTWQDPQGQTWSKNLEPLTQTIVKRYLDFLPRQTYPIRTGVHPNTAFGLSFALDYAKTTKQEELKKLIIKTALKYYKNDENCPASWEPSGSDFFSPCLLEADLMAKVLDKNKFKTWFEKFINFDKSKNLFNPAEVSDRTDPKIVHLDGLNLSRAWCILGVLSNSEQDDNLQKKLLKSANKHIKATLPHIASGDYGGEHWLASFAVYVLSI